MKSPVFNRSKFVLCDVPVPKGYPQSQTHTGIFLSNGNFFLTTTPFPTRAYSKIENYFRLLLRKVTKGALPKPADRFENPCLYIGDSSSLPPKQFKPISRFPLLDTPIQPKGGHSYNSDPDLYIEREIFYILNRTLTTVRSKDGKNVSWSKLSLIEGKYDNEEFSIQNVIDFGEWPSSSIVSHSIIKYQGMYYMMYLDTISALDGKTFNGLFVKKSETILGLKDADTALVKIDSNLLPWHLSLFECGDKLYTIIACVEPGIPKGKVWQMMGEFSDDLSSLKIFDHPLCDFYSYRGSATVTRDGEFILYTPTWHESIPGSKSVDGRDVLMVHTSFDALLKIVKS